MTKRDEDLKGRYSLLKELQDEELDAKMVIWCFVSMPFNKELNKIWYNGIQPCSKQMKDYRIVFTRADKEPYNNRHIEFNVLAKIEEHHILIADISSTENNTAPNPSVMHEIGYASGRNLPVVLIGKKDTYKDLPANLRGSILIEYDIDNLELFIGELVNQLEKTITKEVITKIRGDFTVQCFTNRNRIGIKELIENATSKIQIITTNLQYIYNYLKDSIKIALKKNKDNPEFNVEILTMDPEGDTTVARAEQLGRRTREYRDELRKSLDSMGKEFDDYPMVEIITYTSLPTQITFIIDNTVITAAISFGQRARVNIHFVLDSDRPKVTETFLAHFNTVKAISVRGT